MSRNLCSSTLFIRQELFTYQIHTLTDLKLLLWASHFYLPELVKAQTTLVPVFLLLPGIHRNVAYPIFLGLGIFYLWTHTKENKYNLV